MDMKEYSVYTGLSYSALSRALKISMNSILYYTNGKRPRKKVANTLYEITSGKLDLRKKEDIEEDEYS